MAIQRTRLATSGGMLWFLMACSPAARVKDAGDSAQTQPDSVITGVIDSTARPVVITLHRDSLGLAAGASVQQTSDAVNAAVAELRRLAPFEVLAVSPAILAVQVRPTAPMKAAVLVTALRRHRLVASAEIDVVVRVR